ncbi:tissue factor-like [Clarias gariepinus]|uniref:tissue factor-like n=1 Tax=Clarias gariepinus TaxID=13013 RepID=UPI00234D2BFF|nr:tissue factor-like [Clarias gariepinus]
MRRVPLTHFLLFFFSSVSGGASLPRAQNLTWTSLNFKTVLTWNAVSDHTHTVEFSQVETDRRRNPHCIRISHPECDLTDDLTELKDTYTADVLTEVMTFDSMDLPFTQSKRFCPYEDTVLGAPPFRVELNENDTIVLHITDQQTALYRDGRHLTLRDVFKHDLKYSIVHYKAGSTGTKKIVVPDGEVVMSDLERGPSYCFRVSVYVASRRRSRKLFKWTLPKCSPAVTFDLFAEFDPVLLISALVVIVMFLVAVIVAIVCCCRRRRRLQQTRREEKEEWEGEETQVFKNI